MKIKSIAIDKELRTTGRIIKVMNGSFTVSRIKLTNKLVKKPKNTAKDDSMQIIEEWIPRRDGSKMRILIYKPLIPVEHVPGVLWLHGGGYAMGIPEQAKIMAKNFIKVSNSIVIAPDYRLSVEAPYPAALDDCYDALLWMKENAKKFGIRTNQLMVGGDSAGGGLTAALSLYARDKGEVAIAFQMPLYPMIDDRMTSESAKDNNAPVWNSKSNYLGWNLYLGEQFGTSNVPYYAAPARAKDYSNLPPTATFVGELEPFRDETIQYIENLKKAGVSVNFQLYKGCYHAFEQMCPKADVSKKAIEFIVNSFSFAVNNYYADQKK